MEELISIVIPVYNVKEYLKECVESIYRQSYSNLEIIIVDDGSTDGSDRLCDELILKDDRARVIHKDNAGLSSARNEGLFAAKGKYIVFIDSDDLIDRNMIEMLYEALVQNDSDISVCRYQKFENQNEVVSCVYQRAEIQNMKPRDYMLDIYHGKGTDTGFVAWNKMYKRSLFIDNDITYPAGRIYEDTFTTHRLLLCAAKVSVVNRILYFYRVRPNSIMGQKITRKKCIDGIDADTTVIKDFTTWEETELLSLAFNAGFRFAISAYCMAEKELVYSDSVYCRKYIIDTYGKNWEKYIAKTTIGIPKKIYFKLFLDMPNVVSAVYKILLR